MAWLTESARCDDVRLTSLFGGSECGAPDGKNGVPEVLDSDTEGVVGLIDEAGLPFKDDMVEIRFSHEDDGRRLSQSGLSVDESLSWSTFDLYSLIELCLDTGGEDVCNDDEVADILLQKAGLALIPCDVDALPPSVFSSVVYGVEGVRI